MASLPAELWKWSAADLARGIRNGVISSREAVSACLARMDAVNPKLNAVVEDRREEALAAADAADKAVRAGETLPPLHGVPVTTKINVDQRGSATSNGIVAFKDVMAQTDSPSVGNLRKAGAVIIGRTNTPGFSFRWFTENDLHGRTLSPWDQSRTPGGSSGGASAACAVGIAPINHGNDAGGSVRFPAYCTGVVGLRPTVGRIPAYNDSAAEERPLALQFVSVQGPLTRTVEDCRLALAAMSAYDARDPWQVPAPLTGAPLQRPIRVALHIQPEGHETHPTVADALRHAAAALERAGYIVEERSPPDVVEAAEAWNTLAQGEVRQLLLASIQRNGDANIRRAVELTLEITPNLDLPSHMRLTASRATFIRKWVKFLEDYPLVLCPVALEPPYPYGLDVESVASTQRLLRSQVYMLNTALLGLPCISVPTGIVDGLPTGVQLIGPRFREDVVLDAAEVVEAAHPMPTPIDPQW